jgi:hypothetical protein
MDKVSKERKEKIIGLMKDATDDERVVSWNEKGIPETKKKSNVKQGRISKARGARFELKVRKDLESKGRVIDKWTNNVDLEEDKVVAAKKKFNPFSKAMMLGSGFPDFISIKKIHEGAYSVIGVECKINGTLSKIEKEKCAWYLQKGIFSEIWIAKQGAPPGVPPDQSKGGNKRGEIVYEDFKEKYGDKYNKT